MAAVFGRYGTGPRSFGAACWIPGVKTERTAKKRRKNEQKWARNSHLKRVRVADLFLMDRYYMHDPFAGLSDAQLQFSLGGEVDMWCHQRCILMWFHRYFPF